MNRRVLVTQIIEELSNGSPDDLVRLSLTPARYFAKLALS
jgi:hypothetical protein